MSHQMSFFNVLEWLHAACKAPYVFEHVFLVFLLVPRTLNMELLYVDGLHGTSENVDNAMESISKE